jgi:hypothetical protein
MTFKQTITTFICAQFLSAVIVANVCAQVTVTGHVIAEVIESAHASSKVISDSLLDSEQFNSESLHQYKSSMNTDILSLGAVAIKAGVNIAYSINLNNAALSDNNGNHFTIEPTSITLGQTDTLRSDGSQTLPLRGTASLTHGLASSRYHGSYSVVVLYN